MKKSAEKRQNADRKAFQRDVTIAQGLWGIRIATRDDKKKKSMNKPRFALSK